MDGGGIVDKNVDPAVFGLNTFEQRLDLCVIGMVADNRNAGAAGRSHGRRRVVNRSTQRAVSGTL